MFYCCLSPLQLLTSLAYQTEHRNEDSPTVAFLMTCIQNIPVSSAVQTHGRTSYKVLKHSGSRKPRALGC